MSPHHAVISPDGFKAAWQAMLMDDPHPHNPGFEDCPTQWLERALLAYEHFRQFTSPNPTEANVREYVCSMEEAESPFTVTMP